ncbi:hypothetical protein EE36_14023 [Sulfitobacter sp. EE-36]|nr:hypothetical protein EE36_14023 [Sulfitobacter sp. EE-36]
MFLKAGLRVTEANSQLFHQRMIEQTYPLHSSTELIKFATGMVKQQYN